MNRIEYNSPLGWSVGVIRDLYASADQIEVVAKAGGRKHSFPFVINLSRPAIGELEEALQYVAGKGFEPHEVRASQHVFIQLEKFMDDMRTARSLAAIINAPPPPSVPKLAEVTIGRKFLDQMQRLMQGTEHDGAFSDGQFEERVTELLEMESMVNGSSVLVQDRPLSPEELRDLTGVNSVVRCGLRATDDSHDSETAQRLAAIINNTPPQTVAGRVDLADYLLKEKHIGMAECLSVLETGRLPEETEAITITSPTGEKLTMHFPKERDMATSSKMTIEEYRKEYGEPKHVGEDVFCKCCGKKAGRTFGPAPYECRMGLHPNIEGWMKVFFPIRTTFEGVMQESFDVCTSCAKKVSDYIVYVGKEKSGETGLSDEDLLADDA